MVYLLPKGYPIYDREWVYLLFVFVEISVARLGIFDSIYCGDPFHWFIVFDPIYSMGLGE